MNHALRKPMSPEQYLAWEREQELRWEFDGLQPTAMNGGTNAHSTICMNLAAALVTRLRGKLCRPHGGALKVRIGSIYRYPDAVVACTPIANDADMVTEPVVIFEVLSKSTERTDRTSKLMEYRSLDSVRRYVLLEQDQIMVTTYTRSSGGWIVDQLVAADTLRMPEIGIEIPVAEFYADLSLPDEAS